MRAGRRAGRAARRPALVVTAYEPQGDALVDRAGAPDELRWMLTDRQQAEELARARRAIAAEAGATTVTVQAIAGSPADVLLEAAADLGADCIVVGSVGLRSAAHFVLGSVASVRRPPRPLRRAHRAHHRTRRLLP